jgi:CRP-like cAMP-binding protein
MEGLILEKIKSYLKEFEILDLIDDQLLGEFKIKNFEKNSMILASGDTSGKVMIVLKGEVKAHLYLDDGKEFFGVIRENNFFGLISTVLSQPVKPDFITTKESEILFFPLKKIMDTRKDIAEKIWNIVAIKTAEEAQNIISYTVSRAASSNELFFLKYLENNNGVIRYSSTAELSEELNVHLRTLQRIIKKLSEKNIINKFEKTIEIKNLELFKNEKIRLIH